MNTLEPFEKEDFARSIRPAPRYKTSTQIPLNAERRDLFALEQLEVSWDEGRNTLWTFMTVFEGSISGYHAIDPNKRWILAGRILTGTISGPGLAEIPADRRFYAGGGGTIRGYDYQGVSPRLSTGQIIGGKSLFVASAEARVKITDTIGVVPFVDAGGAFDSDMRRAVRSAFASPRNRCRS